MLIHHYSTWTKLVKTAAWMKRFKQHVMWKFSDTCKDRARSTSCFLAVEEADAAALDLVRFAQQEAFTEVRSMLSDCDGFPNVTWQGSSLGKGIPDALRKLRPILVFSLLRVSGRLQYSPLSVDTKHPFILPKRHHVTELIIHHYHSKVCHCGTQYVFAATREKFWIVHGHSTMRHYLRNCRNCRLWKAKGIMNNRPLTAVSDHPQDTYVNTSVNSYWRAEFLAACRRLHRSRWLSTFVANCAIPGRLLLEKMDKGISSPASAPPEVATTFQESSRW